MLCLVADNTREGNVDPIGRIVASRLRAAMKARGWTQGQVHYQANVGQSDEVISIATVSSVLRGSVMNPGIGTVLALARALDLTLDQVVGISPLPESTPLPIEDDVQAQVTQVAERVDRIATTLDEVLSRLEFRSEALGLRKPGGPGRKRRRRDAGSSGPDEGTDK